MYLFLVVCSMYAYFVVAVETDTDSSYKPSFKKKERPGTEKQRYKLLDDEEAAAY